MLTSSCVRRHLYHRFIVAAATAFSNCCCWLNGWMFVAGCLIPWMPGCMQGLAIFCLKSAAAAVADFDAIQTS